MIVLDASAVLEILLQKPTAAAIQARLFAPDETLHAPHLIDVEVAQVIRRYAAIGAIDDARGRAALTVFAALPLTRYSHGFLLPRIWALRQNFTAYDAAYVVLAETLDAVLLTHDRRLGLAAARHANVELV